MCDASAKPKLKPGKLGMNPCETNMNKLLVTGVSRESIKNMNKLRKYAGEPAITMCEAYDIEAAGVDGERCTKLAGPSSRTLARLMSSHKKKIMGAAGLGAVKGGILAGAAGLGAGLAAFGGAATGLGLYAGAYHLWTRNKYNDFYACQPKAAIDVRKKEAARQARKAKRASK